MTSAPVVDIQTPPQTVTDATINVDVEVTHGQPLESVWYTVNGGAPTVVQQLGETNPFWYRLTDSSVYVVTQRGARALGSSAGKLHLSTDNAKTWPTELAFTDAAKVQFAHLFENGNILFATETKIYLSTNDLASYSEITVKDETGADYTPHTPANSSNPGWYFYSFVADNSATVPGVGELLVWGNYCGVVGGAAPVNIYYSADNGVSVKTAYRFGQNPNRRDDGTAEGGTTGTLLGDSGNSVIARHVHSVRYNAAEDAWYAVTGDHDFAGPVYESHWLRGTYDADEDEWTWTVIVSAARNTRWKAVGLNFVDGDAVWVSDANGSEPHDRGVFRCAPDDIANSANHTLLKSMDYEGNDLMVHGNVMLGGFVPGATPYDSGFFVSLDGGATWDEFDVPALGERFVTRIHKPNGEGWWLIDLNTNWAEKAEVLQVRPK